MNNDIIVIVRKRKEVKQMARRIEDIRKLNVGTLKEMIKDVPDDTPIDVWFDGDGILECCDLEILITDGELFDEDGELFDVNINIEVGTYSTYFSW